MCCFWPKLAVWAGSGVFWRFWPVSGSICPGLLCTVRVGDFFPVFWDGGRLRRLGRDFFFWRGGLLYLGGEAGAAPKCDFLGGIFSFFLSWSYVGPCGGGVCLRVFRLGLVVF